MKPKQNLMPEHRSLISSGHFTADFTLEDWLGPPRLFRFIGWRDDHSAFFVLDGNDGQHVIQPELFCPQSSIRFPEPPTSIVKVRLLAPPFRPTLAEADLLSDMRQLAHNRGRGYQDAVAIYLNEASKRKIIRPTLPEKWELIYEDAIAPKSVPRGNKDLRGIQNKLWTDWCASHGWTPEDMVNSRNQFIRRHGVSDMPSLARINLKMEFKNIAAVWLVNCLVDTPNSTADLDQIRELLDARPEIVRLTPEQADSALGLRPDKKHRTLKGCCDTAKLDFTSLTRANLPVLTMAKHARKDRQSQSGKRTAKMRQKNS